MDEEFIKDKAYKLEFDYGWTSSCAQKFAEFLRAATENSTNCYPENYPYWCAFVVEAYKLPKEKRPDADQILIFLLQEMDWHNDMEPVEGSAHYLKIEYLKSLMLLDNYQSVFGNA